MTRALIMESYNVVGIIYFTHPLNGLVNPFINNISNLHLETSITMAAILWNSVMYVVGVLFYLN